MGEGTGTMRPGVQSSEPTEKGTGDPTSEIREGIEQTREEMAGTVGEIQERLSPSHLKDQVKEQVRSEFHEAKSALRAATIGKVEDMIRNTGDMLSETRGSIWETMKANPVPSALTAVGVTWLVINRRSPRPGSEFRTERDHWRDQQGYRPPSAYGNGHPRHEEERAEAGAGEAIQKVQEKAGQLATQAQAKAGEWVEQGKHQARRVESQVREWMDSNPVAVGLVCLAVGTAVGLALPRTEKEDEWLGEARDTLVEKAQSVAGEAVEKAKEVTTQGSLSSEQESAQPASH